ncbi:MAG: beta-aspartyl-peptidase [Xanthomonadales bacterium]|nr:isoaspartyl peptidase/L-asparaginase [Xanthomonadales bacterium]NIX12583.1 beta-aspartyl-peptidase [Xanthomonadales bacterium]
MNRISALLLMLCLSVPGPAVHAGDGDASVAIAIHGGAGTMHPDDMTPEREQAYRAKLEEAARAGHGVLTGGGTSLDAVTAAINVLEDSPLFNAGKGAVFNAAGQNELDASIMDGATLNAGAVAAVHRVRNPINLALKVMTDSKHVMMIGDGAEKFAVEQGFDLVDPVYFRTEHRWEALQRAKANETAGLAADRSFYSTVGTVALDRNGNLAAGTSTGGMTNKRWGRVGDSPIIGAGTYADNDSCAVSATGHGEYFIRWVVAYNICNRVAAGASVTEAGEKVINDILVGAGGSGGVIIMGADGDIAMPFNTAGMYRASIDASGELFIGIYGDDE